MIEVVRKGLSASHSPKLVDELLEAYVEAKRNFYLGGLRLSAVEGGRRVPRNLVQPYERRVPDRVDDRLEAAASSEGHDLVPIAERNTLSAK